MATRPVFIPSQAADTFPLVETRHVSFLWHPGMAPSQKRKNAVALHDAASSAGLRPLLEVSTKSGTTLGRELSAFNLMLLTASHGEISVESAFQGSKVFSSGGPYPDLYGRPGREIKKDIRLSGTLHAFEFEGDRWGLLPRTAFYDWLYMTALHTHAGLANALLAYKGFTDIEFNPKKSLNCQAYSCALYVALSNRSMIEKALSDRGRYLEVVSQNPSLF